MLIAEHAALGLVAGTVGAAGASLLTWIVLTRIMELPWHPRIGTLLIAVVATSLLAAASATAVSLRALRSRPIEALGREE